MNFDLGYISELLQAILLAVLPVLAAAGIRWLVSEVKVAQAKLTTEQQVIVKNIVTVAVLAAEQFGLVAKAKGILFEKKDWALGIVTARLKEIGLDVDFDYISEAIEAAVLDEFNRYKYWQDEAEPEPAAPVEEKG